MGGRGCAGKKGVQGGKWDNCNSLINKIYLKKKNNKTVVFGIIFSIGQKLFTFLLDKMYKLICIFTKSGP